MKPVRQALKRLSLSVPSSPHSEEYDAILDAPYFWGYTNQEDVENALEKHGEYVVRYVGGKDKVGSGFVISVKWKQDTFHLFIRFSKRGRYIIEDEEFGTVDSLITHYITTRRILTKSTNACLLRPAPRPDWLLRKREIRMLKKLGEGNFGQVWSACRIRSDGSYLEVAVKFMKDSDVPKEEIISFYQECKRLRHVQHENLCNFIGIIVDVRPVRLVMELCEYTLLSYLTANAGKLSKATKVNFCLQVCNGMAYLASEGYIHRDLAARNCLMKNGIVKISDLGMAREGSVYHMHPAIKPIPIKWTPLDALKTRTFSEKSDVWSFGVLMWEIWADGQSPYSDMQNKYGVKFPAKLMAFLDAGNRLEFPPTTAEGIREVAAKCWQSKASDRPTFKEIHALLEKIAGQETYI